MMRQCFLPIVLIITCATQVLQAYQIEKHPLFGLMHSASPAYWCHVTPEEFSTHYFNEVSPSWASKVVILNGEVVTRMQHWVDFFHSKIAAAVPTLKTPKPQVIISKSLEANAVIFGIEKAHGSDLQRCIPDIIVINIGALIVTQEDFLVGTIAHELGHYYLAHHMRPHDFDFFYDLKSRLYERIPQKEEQSFEMEAFLKILSEKKGQLETYAGSLGHDDYSNDEGFEQRAEELRAVQSAVDQQAVWGMYTDEEQADEFATLLLALSGLPPHAQIQKLLNVSSLFYVAMNQKKEAIIAQYQSGFINQGQLLIPSVFISDSHHSFGFRVYAGFQMIKQLKLDRAEYNATHFMSPTDWQALIDRVLSDKNMIYNDASTPFEFNYREKMLLKFGLIKPDLGYWLLLISTKDIQGLRELITLGELKKLDDEERKSLLPLLSEIGIELKK